MTDENIPTYRYTLLPGGGELGSSCDTCEWCGALVIDRELHTLWHNPFYRSEQDKEDDALLTYLDEMDKLYGPPSPEALAEAKKWFDDAGWEEDT